MPKRGGQQPGMHAFGFDPHREQRRFEWRNQIVAWRADAAQTVFHAFALLAVALVAIYIIGIAGPQALQWLALALDQAPAAMALVAVVALLSAQWRAIRLEQRVRANDWLAAQPVAPMLQQQRLRQQLLLRTSVYWAGGAAVLGAAAMPIDVQGGWAALNLAAAIGAVWAAESPARAHPKRSVRATPFAAEGRGSFWRWQCAEAGVSLGPKRLSAALLVLLLVPRGSWQMAYPALLLVAIAVTANAWQRSLSVLVNAERLLATQPHAPSRLLLGCAAHPAALLGLIVLVSLVLTPTASPLRLLLALGLPAFGILQWCCLAAERRRPTRGALLFAVQFSLLLAALQSLTAFAPVLWLFQILLLLRRGVRE